jgi:copper ion binding protein
LVIRKDLEVPDKIKGGYTMKKKINIEGMSCMHCVKHVEESVKDLPGVLKVTVDLKGKNAVVELSDSVEDAKLKEAIEEAGYDVTGITNI